MIKEDPGLPGEILGVLKELGMGLVNHGNWLKVLHRSLICGEPPEASDLADDAHHRCLFGQWYYGGVDDRLQQLPIFSEVGELHRKVHERARGLLLQKQSGSDIGAQEYDAFVDMAHEFRVAVQNLQFSMISRVCAVDHLTGVWNRYAMAHKLAQEYERVRRTGRPCAVALMDFDHFKSINDNHGHVVGDRVLRETMQYLVGQMRKYDAIFRYGGEEFLFLFPDTPLDQAEKLLDRLREDVKNIPVKGADGREITITVSIGLSRMDAASGEQGVIELADSALCNAKLGGRDRVVVM